MKSAFVSKFNEIKSSVVNFSKSCKSKITTLFGKPDPKNKFNFDSLDIGNSNCSSIKNDTKQNQQCYEPMEISSTSFAKLDSQNFPKHSIFNDQQKTLPTTQLSNNNKNLLLSSSTNEPYFTTTTLEIANSRVQNSDPLNELLEKTQNLNIDQHFEIHEEIEKPKLPEYNILLMGGTGTGKSTTINAFANYVKFSNIEEASNQTFVELIASSFMLYNYNTGEEFPIVSGEIIKEFSEGQSVTQDPMAYKFYFNNKLIRLIDTPGLGDTRGLEADKANFDKIFEYLRAYKQLHGIVILMKSNETREVSAFRYCISELFSKLHRSASQNIVICFTFGRNTYYRAGDGFIIMKEFLKNDFPEMELTLKTGENCFFIDNEAYRYLVAKKCGYPFDPCDKTSYSESWNKSAHNTREMISNILKLTPHELDLTFKLNMAQNLIMEIAETMVRLQKNIFLNIENIERQKNNIFKLKDDFEKIDDLKNALKVVVEHVKVIPLKLPNTVCTSGKCTEIVTINNEQTVNYKSICCVECPVKNVKQSKKDQKLLKKCETFPKGIGGKIGPCISCGCSWKTHVHIKYEFKNIKHTVVDRKKFLEYKTLEASNEQNFQLSSNIILELEELIAEYKKEINVIQKAAACFGYLLKMHSNSSFNQVIEPYLELLIAEEQLKINKVEGYSTKTFEMLVELQTNHSEHVEKVAESVKNGNTLDFCNITDIAESLCNLKHYGEQFLNLVTKFADDNDFQFNFQEKEGVTISEDF